MSNHIYFQVQCFLLLLLHPLSFLVYRLHILLLYSQYLIIFATQIIQQLEMKKEHPGATKTNYSCHSKNQKKKKRNKDVSDMLCPVRAQVYYLHK